eukprot:CAMPEP_0201668684 /NCGR_PEP_ID=MMETSP0494-20130426/20599_1 /ASSEMBLY_ACC=CAM_ASM_000839 /TAXON_ID=420259 /ORGANISM="Thalassiosira gravida, Strain GMp14c1" /LENGTH=256 /DNA_ID=CAMNT_0048149183 /DNA_START=656 /DNA_END=1427 /DNA_ORIENTATION=-
MDQYSPSNTVHNPLNTRSTKPYSNETRTCPPPSEPTPSSSPPSPLPPPPPPPPVPPWANETPNDKSAPPSYATCAYASSSRTSRLHTVHPPQSESPTPPTGLESDAEPSSPSTARPPASRTAPPRPRRGVRNSAPTDDAQSEIVRIAVLARHAGGAKVIGVRCDGRDLHETAGPVVVGRLGFVADEDLGRGGFDVDVVFDGEVDQVFDAFDVVGVFDAYETTVGFGKSSNNLVVVGSTGRFELLRHVGTEFLLGRC